MVGREGFSFDAGGKVNFDRQIFLSAVSSEFRRCREMLCSDLTGPDMPWKVAEQADFAVGGRTLLDKLNLYIQESNAVIHLIGDAMGSCAKPLEVEAFLKGNPDFLVGYPTLRAALGDCLDLSYTQWEAYMALDHGVSLFVFSPDGDFAERQAGFVADEVEREKQSAHRERLRSLGMDRATFPTAERLSSMVLRSLSGLVARSGEKADVDFAESLESIAKLRETSDDEAAVEGTRTAILPFHLELLLPSHLVAGQSSRLEFHIREPGRTPLEAVEVELELGSAKVCAKRDLLMQEEDVRMVGDSQLIPAESGMPRIKLAVTCSRQSSLRERFVWSSFATVHPAEKAEAISPTARQRLISQRVDLELEDEILLPRQGALGMELRPVPAARRRFEMGSPKSERGRQADEEVHPVKFRRSWWMARHPVSQEQFLELMGSNPSKFASQSANLPVESVTWEEAKEFCERLTQRERAEESLLLGFQYRLPTEAEWEFSYRGDEVSTGPMASSRTGTECGVVSHSISTFPLDGNRGANRLGLCDMAGNVFQWCLDGYGAYPHLIEADPFRVGDGVNRIIRGGSWHDPSEFRRPAARAKCKASTRSSRIGFRVVLARV
jgi:formylglycine-generating enzyme required for sulfatase activity